MAGTGTLARSATEALDLVGSIDLTMVRMKLADPKEGKGWSTAEISRYEGEYRRFLVLHLMFPGMEVAPCKEVDEYWHAHILDTRAYQYDTERVFGYFLHHFPYFGIRSAQDALDLIDAYDETLRVYEEVFAEAPADCWLLSSAGKCRTQCKPQKCK